MKKVLWNGLLFMASLYLGILVIVYLFQNSFLYIPDQEVPSSAQLARTDFTAVTITSEGESKTTSLWKPPTDQTRPVFMHLHGNAGSHYHRIPLYRALAQNGSGVLGVGYPGYGGNVGSPSEEGLYLTAQANYDWLLAKGIAAERIIIVGQSLGTGPAVWLASKNSAAGLILEAAYTGIDDMAQKQFPFLPAKMLSKNKYPSIDRIRQINMPLVWIHGTADEIIPFSMGQKLFDAADQPKTAIPMRNGGHNDLWERGIDEIIRAESAKFFLR